MYYVWQDLSKAVNHLAAVWYLRGDHTKRIVTEDGYGRIIVRVRVDNSPLRWYLKRDCPADGSIRLVPISCVLSSTRACGLLPLLNALQVHPFPVNRSLSDGHRGRGVRVSHRCGGHSWIWRRPTPTPTLTRSDDSWHCRRGQGNR